MKWRFFILLHCTLPLRSIHLWRFKLVPWIVVDLSSEQIKPSMKTTKGSNSKIIRHRILFLCIALHLYQIYPPVKFQVSSLNTFGLMLRTIKCGQTQFYWAIISIVAFFCFLVSYYLRNKLHCSLLFLHQKCLFVQTDKVATICSPLREHKNQLRYW